jgi:hypothetical protein
MERIKSDKKKGAPQRPFSVFSRSVLTNQNFSTSVPLTVRGAPIWTKPGEP